MEIQIFKKTYDFYSGMFQLMNRNFCTGRLRVTVSKINKLFNEKERRKERKREKKLIIQNRAFSIKSDTRIRLITAG